MTTRTHVVNQKIYEWLKPKKVFMVGEMHGTNEPAQFLTGLSELFLKNGDSVQVGFEIPSEEMKAYLQKKTPQSISESDFFATKSLDGRASVTWAAAIERIGKHPKAKIFFFDINNADQKRDSSMYFKIKDQILKHPNSKILTISGNAHNIRIPFNGRKFADGFLTTDSELSLSNHICTLDHRFDGGTMRNNTGNRLEFRQAKSTSPFAQNNELENYMYLFPKSHTNAHDGIFYTRKVSAAEMVKK